MPILKLRTLADIPSKRLIFPTGTQWGAWTLHANYTLTHSVGYEIDLEQFDTSAEMLDTIFQVTQKTWCTAQDAKDFLEAIRDLFNPQATLCSFGVDRKFNASRHIKKIVIL